MPVSVEIATPSDFLQIAVLDRIAWDSRGFIVDGEHTWRVWCEYATVLVVRGPSSSGDGGQAVIAALVMFPTHDRSLFLHKIMVDPQSRGKGLGTALMQAALSRATAPVLLTVDPANQPAVDLYRKQGFVVRDHVKGYYRSNEDRYVMVYTPGAG